MAEKKEPRDEKLIEELYERLWWYTYEASEEEFDEKEVDAITRLLDVLEPVYDDPAYEPGADAALKRFWERYGEEEENAAMEDSVSVPDGPAFVAGAEIPKADEKEHSAEKICRDKVLLEKESGEEVPGAGKAAVMETSDSGTSEKTVDADAAKLEKEHVKSSSRKRWRKHLTRIAVGVAACIVLLISVNVGSYALRKKSFFEIVREEIGRTEITVTGNTEGIENVENNDVECSSWGEVMDIIGEEILVPTYIPEGYELKSLVVKDAESRWGIVGRYENEEGNYIKIRINMYQEEFKKDMMQYGSDWDVITGDTSNKDIQYYGKNNLYETFFSDNKCIYYIITNENVEQLEKIVDGMKK
ncbi:MAG TPA: DUF4367 domain-containing protein [Candidatus Blautia excrementipullorum]|nr:DUF4367 domain-containing protein [Candidatus Blautia excrementipullorum]